MAECFMFIDNSIFNTELKKFIAYLLLILGMRALVSQFMSEIRADMKSMTEKVQQIVAKNETDLKVADVRLLLQDCVQFPMSTFEQVESLDDLVRVDESIRNSLVLF